MRVSGSEAQHLIRRCQQAVDAERKVLIGFRLGDLWTDTFTYNKGKRAGEQGVSLKARLLFVSWIKVDGQLVYKAEPRATDAVSQDSTPPVANPAPVDDAPASNLAAPEIEAENTVPAESFS